MYQPRTYRHWVRGDDLVFFSVAVNETDLFIRAATNLKRRARRLVVKYRDMLEGYIKRYPLFLTSLVPVTTGDDAPQIVREMARAAQTAGVGPMASVAGAIAEFIGNELSTFSPEIIIENGGDIYMKSLKKRVVGIYAGNSPLTGRIGFEIRGEDTPLGICTSSGTVGPSLSYGQADAVVVLARSATLADAAATAIGNLITDAQDIEKGLEFAQNVDGLGGALVIKDDNLGVWGEVKLCDLSRDLPIS